MGTHRPNPKADEGEAPLPIFIESLYFKRFGKERPDIVRTVEETVAASQAKKAVKRQAKQARRAAAAIASGDEAAAAPGNS